jgi:hypothetical protein
VARFLSPEWFAALAELCGEPGASQPDLVVEVAVSGAPEGEVRYYLVVEGERARAVRSTTWPAQVRISAGYNTLCAIASGRLPALEALASGLAKFSGSTSAISSLAQAVAGADLLPPALRASTTY